MMLLTLLFIVGLTSVYSEEKCIYSSNECATGLFMLLASPIERAPATPKEMQDYCKLLDGFLQCSVNITKSCPEDKSVKVLSGSLKAQIEDICTSESQQKLIMDTAPCLLENIGDINQCLWRESPQTYSSDHEEECNFNSEFIGCMYYEAEEACSTNGRIVTEMLYKPHNDFTESYCTTD